MINKRNKIDLSGMLENSICNQIKKRIAEDPDYVYTPCTINFTDIRKEKSNIVAKAIWRGV